MYTIVTAKTKGCECSSIHHSVCEDYHDYGCACVCGIHFYIHFYIKHYLHVFMLHTTRNKICYYNIQDSKQYKCNALRASDNYGPRTTHLLTLNQLARVVYQVRFRLGLFGSVIRQCLQPFIFNLSNSHVSKYCLLRHRSRIRNIQGRYSLPQNI